MAGLQRIEDGTKPVERLLHDSGLGPHLVSQAGQFHEDREEIGLLRLLLRCRRRTRLVMIETAQVGCKPTEQRFPDGLVQCCSLARCVFLARLYVLSDRRSRRGYGNRDRPLRTRRTDATVGVAKKGTVSVPAAIMNPTNCPLGCTPGLFLRAAA